MSATEKVVNDLNVSKIVLCDLKMLTPEMCVKIGQAINGAIDLLKEQEPKNVIAEKRKILFDDLYDEARYYEDTFYYCPSCNRHLSRTHTDKNIHFCSSCGQAVKWE